MQSDLAGTVERLISRLQAETLKAVALPMRDAREPGRRRKQLADARLYAVIERIFRGQKLQLAAWLTARALSPNLPMPINWNAVGDRDMAELTLTLTEARQDGITLFSEQVQTGIDYTAVNARAARQAQQYAGQLIRDVDKTTLDAVRQVVAAFAETPGMTVGDVIAQLPFDPERSRMIAVTEITRAYAEGEMEAGRELQKKYPDVAVIKTWFTNNDEKVCPICEPLDGAEVPFDKGWTEGGEADPEGLQSPPAHPNCRCWIQTSTKI